MTPGSRRSLDTALVKGVAWTGAASWAAQTLSWVTTLVVVRLLTPEDYGLVGIAQVYLGLVLVCSEFGIGTAVVTLRSLTEHQVAQLNSVALFFSGIAFGCTWALAGPLSEFFAEPRLVILLMVSSSSLILTAVGVVSSAGLQRRLEFGFLARAQVVQSAVAAATTLTLALAGGGYWALALGTLMGQGTLSAQLVVRAPCGYAWPVWSSVRTALRFSRQVLFERLAWYGYSGSDKLVIGKVLGEVPLGLYNVASTFGMLAVEKFSVLMLRVAPAILSAVQSDPVALRRYLLSMTEAMSVVTFPVSIGLALVAEDVVVLVLGERWMGAVAVLQVLGVLGAYQSVTALLTRVLAVIGETRFCMHVALGTLLVMLPAFLVASRWGLVGVAATWLVIFPFTQAPLYLRLRRRIQLRAGEYLLALWPAASAVLVMTAGILLLDRWPAFHDLHRAANLTLSILAGASLYTGSMLLMHAERIRRFRELLADVRRGRPPPQGAASG